MSMEDRLARLRALQSEGETAKAEKEAQATQERSKQDQERAVREQESVQIQESIAESQTRLSELTEGLQKAEDTNMEGFPAEVAEGIQTLIADIKKDIETANAEIQELQQRLDTLTTPAEESTEAGVDESQPEGVDVVEGTEQETTEKSVLEQSAQEIADSADIPEEMKQSAVVFLNQIKDKDPQTVSWFGVLFKDFDPSLEQAQQYSADYDSESRRVADVLSKTADGKGIDYNLLNEKERGEFDADRDRFCEYEKIISPTAFKNFLEGASSEEEKKQIKEKYEAEEPRRRAISEQSSSNFLSRYKLREKDSKERSANLRNQVRSKEDVITNNPKYQKTIDAVKGVYDKMRERLDGLKKDSNE